MNTGTGAAPSRVQESGGDGWLLEAPAGRARLPISCVRSTSTDFFPGRLAAVVYCGGEPAPAGDAGYSWRAVEHFLSSWGDRLTGVAFTDIEPDLLPALRFALLRSRELGYATALHTEGSAPVALRPLLEHLDWLSLEISPAHSGRANVQASLLYVLESGIDFECRTRLQGADLDWLRREAARLAGLGVRNYAVYLQRPERLPRQQPELCRELRELFLSFSLRQMH